MNEKLIALRKLLEGKTVECPECHGVRSFVSTAGSLGGTLPTTTDCPRCYGTGNTPDPAFAPLLEVVRVEVGDHWHEFVTRSWDGLPEGALAGALLWALVESDPGFSPSLVHDDNGHWAVSGEGSQPAMPKPETLVIEILSEDSWKDNPDEAALDAVLEALSA